MDRVSSLQRLNPNASMKFDEEQGARNGAQPVLPIAKAPPEKHPTGLDDFLCAAAGK